MRTTIQVGLATAAAVITLTVAHAPCFGQAGSGPNAPKSAASASAIATVTLSAAPDTELILSGLVLEMLSDGSRRVSGRSVWKHQSVARSFFFVIDPILRTYVAFPVESVGPGTPAALSLLRRIGGAPDALMKAASVERQRLAEIRRNQLLLSDPPPNCGAPSPGCDTPCTGSWTVQITAYDPAFIALARTNASASWSEAGTQTCTFRSGASGGCAGSSPTPIFHTNWFVTSCPTWGTGFHQGDPHVAVEGNYANTDFGTSAATYVRQFVSIDRQSGDVITSWQHIDWGEFSLLVFGLGTDSGNDSCGD